MSARPICNIKKTWWLHDDKPCIAINCTYSLGQHAIPSEVPSQQCWRSFASKFSEENWAKWNCLNFKLMTIESITVTIRPWWLSQCWSRKNWIMGKQWYNTCWIRTGGLCNVEKDRTGRMGRVVLLYTNYTTRYTSLHEETYWEQAMSVIYIYIIQIVSVCVSVKYRRPNCWTDHDQIWHAYADRPGNGSYQKLAPWMAWKRGVTGANLRIGT